MRADKGAGDAILTSTCKVWTASFTWARLHPERVPGESAPAVYLLQLVQELLVALILAAAGLDQTVAQVLSDHLGGVQVSEDAGKQVRDVLRAQRGGAQTQHLRLRDRRERSEPGVDRPRGEAVLATIDEGARGPQGGPSGEHAGRAGPGPGRGGRPQGLWGRVDLGNCRSQLFHALRLHGNGDAADSASHFCFRLRPFRLVFL